MNVRDMLKNLCMILGGLLLQAQKIALGHDAGCNRNAGCNLQIATATLVVGMLRGQIQI